MFPSPLSQSNFRKNLSVFLGLNVSSIVRIISYRSVTSIRLTDLSIPNFSAKDWNRKQHDTPLSTREIKGVISTSQTVLPSEGGTVGGVVSICHWEPQEDVTVGFVLLNVDRVVTLREYRCVVINVLDVDVKQNTCGERWRTLIFCFYLQHWKINRIISYLVLYLF